MAARSFAVGVIWQIRLNTAGFPTPRVHAPVVLCRYMSNLVHGQLADLHTPDANFRGFLRRVRQTRAVDVPVVNGSQVVVSRSDIRPKCLTRLVGGLTSLSASWPATVRLHEIWWRHSRV